MTSKAVISQIEVNERRLKGIYDQLESGSFKKAIAEADKVLKKNPNLLQARVLKALAMYRSGKTQESFSIVNEVVSITPTDESTLNTLSYFFKESNQKNRIVDIYEEAYKMFPNREDICINLFNCHVKSFNYLSQQKVAIQLKKMNASHMEYGMWPMVGNVLHGVYNNDTRLVKLGEAMLTKYFNSNAILSAERIEFLVFIFEKLSKFAECYDWLCGPTLKDAVDSSQNKTTFTLCKIDLLLKLARRKEAIILQWELIEQNLDNIGLWKEYIDNAIELNLEAIDPNSLESIAKKLMETDNNRIAIKVAKVHLSIALEKSKLDKLFEFSSKLENIVEYYIKFGDRSSCFYDIYTFLCMDCFSDTERKEVLKRINEHFGSTPIACNKEVERCYLISALKRAVEGSRDMNVDDLIETYKNALPLSVDFGPTEIKPCDNFVKLAVSCYVDRWRADGSDSKPLLDAVILLRQALESSPANYNLRLQLSHIYGLLCCQDLAIGQFNNLEIKQLMWDSLGHHFIIPALSVPCFDRRVTFLKKNITRKQKNKLEIEENLVTCYKLGNYGRIPEIIDFHQAIEASVMSRLSETEIIYVNMVLKSNSCDDLFGACGAVSLAEVESTDPGLDILASLSCLKDYRDLKTSPDFSSIDCCWSADHQQSSFRHIILWIAQRYLTLRSYYCCAKVTMETVVKLDILSRDSTASFTDDRSSYYNVLQACRNSTVDVWSQMTTLSGSYGNLSNDLTGCVEPPSDIFGSYFSDVMVAFIDSVTLFHDHFVRRLSTASMPDLNQTLMVPIRAAFEEFRLSIQDCQEGSAFSLVPRSIGLLTVLCELLSVATMNVTMLENMTRPIRPKGGQKRKGKKKVADGDNETVGEEYRRFLCTSGFPSIPGSLAGVVADVEGLLAGLGSQAGVAVDIAGEWRAATEEAGRLLAGKRAQLEVVAVAAGLQMD